MKRFDLLPFCCRVKIVDMLFAVCTHLPLSASSIICLKPKHGDAMRLRKVRVCLSSRTQ